MRLSYLFKVNEVCHMSVHCSFAVNIGPGEDTIAFHLNPRFNAHGDSNIIVCNSFEGGNWCQEQREQSFPFSLGQEFKVCLHFSLAWVICNLLASSLVCIVPLSESDLWWKISATASLITLLFDTTHSSARPWSLYITSITIFDSFVCLSLSLIIPFRSSLNSLLQSLWWLYKMAQHSVSPTASVQRNTRP